MILKMEAVSVAQPMQERSPAIRPGTQFVRQTQEELSSFYKLIQTFEYLEPDQVMVTLAGISGRACEIRAMLVRKEDRVSQKLRTMEVEPLIEECDRQFKVWSRIQSIRELEWKMSGGGV